MQDTLAEDLQFCMSGPDKATYHNGRDTQTCGTE